MAHKSFFYLKVITSLLLLTFLLVFIDIKSVYQEILVVGYHNFLLILLVTFILFIVQALRLHLLIKHHVQNYGITLKLSFIGQFFSSFLPGSITGDIYKVFFLKRQKISIAGAGSLIALDRAIGFIWTLIFGLYYLFFLSHKDIQFYNFSDFSILYLALALAIVSISFVILYKKKISLKINHFIQSIKQELQAITLKRYLFFLIISFAVYLLRLFRLYFMVILFGQTISFSDLFLVVFLVQLSVLIPLSIGGLGVMEASLTYGLMIFSISAESSLAIAFANRFTILFFSFVGGMVWLAMKRRINTIKKG